MSKPNTEVLVQRAIELADTVNDHYYDLGEVLHTLKTNDLYKVVDNNKYWSSKHQHWKLFCEDKLSISYRTAQYYISMYAYFTSMHLTKEDLQGIGWSKAKELIDVSTDRDILDQCLAVAATGTLQELQAFIEEFVFRVGDNRQEELKGRNISFRLYGAAASRCHEIVDIAAKSTNGDKNEAFLKMCIEWFQLTNPIKDVEDLVTFEDVESAYDRI